jgi:hypothetical protein
MMTYAEFHLAVRMLLAPTRFRSFICNVEVVEHHPNRVAVEWRVCVFDSDGAQQKIAHHVRRGDPFRVLEALTNALAGDGEPAPAVLEQIGDAPAAVEDAAEGWR